MTSIDLVCSSGCGMKFTLISRDGNSSYFIQKYGEVDRVARRPLIVSCPNCKADMERAEPKEAEPDLCLSERMDF